MTAVCRPSAAANRRSGPTDHISTLGGADQSGGLLGERARDDGFAASVSNAMARQAMPSALLGVQLRFAR